MYTSLSDIGFIFKSAFGVTIHPVVETVNVGVIGGPSQFLLSYPSAFPVALPPTITLI